MPSMTQIAEHRKVQQAAKRVLQRLEGMIRANDSEKSIALKVCEMLAEYGVTETWYYQCPSLVLLGTRSCISVSGKDYEPTDELVGRVNLVTVDISPSLNGLWGDCARSFPVEGGQVRMDPYSLEFRNGMAFSQRLHDEMREFVTPVTTFKQLYEWTNLRIRQSGFVNLDYRSNVGHSIATHLNDRLYIESDNSKLISSVDFFSFEPFIRLKGGKWGFKHEGIYFFNSSGRLEEL